LLALLFEGGKARLSQLAVPRYDDELAGVDPALLGGVAEYHTIVSAREGGKRSCIIVLHG